MRGQLFAVILATGGWLVASTCFALNALTVGYRCDVSRVTIDTVNSEANVEPLTEPSMFGCNAMAVDGVGNIYAAGSFSEVFRVDPATGEFSLVFDIANPIEGRTGIRSMAVLPSGPLLLANDNLPTTATQRLLFVEIDLAENSLRRLGKPPFDGLQAMEYSPDGQLYGWAGLRNLVRIDPYENAFFPVGEVDKPILNLQTLAFSPDGRLFGMTLTSLYEIDIRTGDARFIVGGFQGGIRGLVFLPEPSCAVILLAGMIFSILMDRAANN